VREYDADEIKAAFEETLGESPVDDLLSRRIRDPKGLATTIAVELARTIVPRADLTVGATSVICGILVGSRLPPQEPGIVSHLPDALSTVRSFGRHAVIARQCDLAAVAEVETAVVAALGPAHRKEDLLVLFELGLALGLAARPEVPQA
jgi:hypothetical protein